jgi:ornithine cyclodeaminase
MANGSINVISGHEVLELLRGREGEIMDVVGRAYVTHAAGDSSLPHSTFLHFPSDRRSRIIALPAYLGGEFNVAGLKWIGSFPSNLERGLDRASAVIILNSTETGRPELVVEGSIVSAKRTAASAALAARALKAGGTTAGLIGCSLINFEIARFLRAALPELKEFVAYDLDRKQIEFFRERCQQSFGVRVRVAQGVEEVLGSATLVSMATSAVEPHIFNLNACAPGSVILHISLRDLAPEVILHCDNVVDDVDHVCRAQTSVHLALQLIGHREFIRCTLGDIINGVSPPRRDDKSIVVFSPFGLGILDLALAKLVRDLSDKIGCGELPGQPCGQLIDSFLPEYWKHD